MEYHIKDIELAPAGRKKIEWVRREMSVLSGIAEQWKKEKPLDGVLIAACLHVTSETAVLMITLKEGGAKVALCASNPLSTQDEVAASLVKDFGINVYAICGEDRETYYQHIDKVLETSPQITMDDGADLVSTLHQKGGSRISQVIGGTEETTTGVVRLKSMAKAGQLRYPVIAVNDADTKHLFDNRYGTGQSTLEGILRATHILLSGKKVVVVGYGWCGRGIALRARGMGARVGIVEINPVKALEALMDGYEVMPMLDAAAWGDLFITVTGNISVIRKEHFLQMNDGAILCNSGHFNVEIDQEDLESVSVNRREVRPLVEEFTLSNGKKLFFLAEGRLVNLACAEGHPPTVMDMSFANQALSVKYLKEQAISLENQVYKVPDDIDMNVAGLKLSSLSVKIEELTPRQKKYLASWEEGT
ncbi:MAG TPA: adenosylhomocysteinase [Atribacter sp.]|jgi:adenosylhomocysteinase|uniref:adenosylhomocysteinase n=1 Tax=Atribacter sp. TaxID=2847780 RepID=UPI00176D01B0|nr:adenosylhomocysteinase [Atribacter sp.]MDD3713735.1 adenosylhomocysteinase [Atribacterota bacterium]MDI9595597.1 adenosylhomocysteinase [Atribacterota bacterium]HHT08746.1 adenosylhomocysteinase [Candidatus Atribacteria bacterium]HQK82374.1 adenosylhomocysteinase [Atribacter sp.]